MNSVSPPTWRRTRPRPKKSLHYSPLAALQSSEAVRSSRVIDTAAPIDAAPLKSPHRVRVSLIWESLMSHSLGPLVSDSFGLREAGRWFLISETVGQDGGEYSFANVRLTFVPRPLPVLSALKLGWWDGRLYPHIAATLEATIAAIGLGGASGIARHPTFTATTRCEDRQSNAFPSMLASFAASMVNRKLTDLKIPNRF
jgi:hypothetical protein